MSSTRDTIQVAERVAEQPIAKKTFGLLSKHFRDMKPEARDDFYALGVWADYVQSHTGH